ncbi:MAG: hypothetical protein J3R72DRAFT_509531 [Linnemannia gamsii]|nr:MAG: hypothetical protein J3R72DRAFT_509531 [Linnemannia gamsii]
MSNPVIPDIPTYVIRPDPPLPTASPSKTYVSPPPPSPKITTITTTTTITDSTKSSIGGGVGIISPPGITPSSIDPSKSANPTTTTGRVSGDITFLPGQPTSFRESIAPTASSISSTDSSHTLVASSMTGVLFAFAFVGALIIGFAAGIIVLKYTRFGRRKEHKKAQGELTEQLRILTDTLGQRNDHLDREEKAIQAAANQGELMPPWYYQSRHCNGLSSDRLQPPQSVPDQTAYYQDWATAYGSGSPFVSSTLRQPRVINLPPMQLPPDVEIGGPGGEWPNNIIGSPSLSLSSSSSPNRSASDLNEFERRRPQIQEEGQGEDSLFDVGNRSHNPHISNSSLATTEEGFDPYRAATQAKTATSPSKGTFAYIVFGSLTPAFQGYVYLLTAMSTVRGNGPSIHVGNWLGKSSIPPPSQYPTPPNLRAAPEEQHCKHKASTAPVENQGATPQPHDTGGDTTNLSTTCRSKRAKIDTRIKKKKT